MNTQVNSLQICSFSKILSLKSFGNSWLACSVSGDNFVFYFSTISWIRLQQETMCVNINFEIRDLTSSQKRHAFPRWFRRNLFVFNLIKQNVTHFSFIFLTKTFFCAPEKLKFKLLLPGTISFSTSYQRWFTKLLISTPSPPLLLVLLDMQPHQIATFKSR